MAKKVAVVLFNLGGPDSKEAIKPFLFNFFTDKNIIRLPYPFRWGLAKLIAARRSKREAGESYGELGDRSPLLENSRAQAHSLEKYLNAEAGGKDYRCFITMRYWHPMAPQVTKEVKDWGADEIILLPLYPQFSTTTTRSSLQVWNNACRKNGLDCPTRLVCCYPTDADFVGTSARKVREIYDEAAAKSRRKKGKKPRILLSAHGLPISVIKDGDPYQFQCEETARAIMEATGLKDADWLVSYQSRVGPQKWVGPATEEEIERAGEENVPLIIYPHAFTQEHVETLVELGIEYKEVADEAGVPDYYVVPTVGTDAQFIRGLAAMVKKAEDWENGKIAPDTGERLCPGSCRRCCVQEGELVCGVEKQETAVQDKKAA